MKKIQIIIFILGTAYFIFLIRQDIISMFELKKEEQSARKKMEFEEKRFVYLKDRLNRLKTDELIEEIARTRLGMIKKGETAYKVID